MIQMFHLYRRPADSSGLSNNWSYANRVADGAGETLYSGSTPNEFFKSTVTFRDAAGQDALVFGANRTVAPRAFLTSDASGHELFRIDLPRAAKLRPKTPM